MWSSFHLAQTFEDDGFQIPIGSWVRQVVDWMDDHLQGAFDPIVWPFDQAMGLMENADGEFMVVPRLVVLVVLGIAAYVGGGYRRAGYVISAVGFMALMGNTTWRNATFTLYSLLVVLTVVGLLTAIITSLVRLIATNRDPGALPYYQHVLMGWSWIHPYGVMLPAVLFFGIGQTTSLLLATFMALPVSLGASASGRISTGVRLGLRASVFPATLLFGFLAIIGLGGLSFPLFRALSNQDVALISQTTLALWLVGFVAWCLLGPWNLDHLPGRKHRSVASERVGEATASAAAS